MLSEDVNHFQIILFLILWKYFLHTYFLFLYQHSLMRKRTESWICYLLCILKFRMLQLKIFCIYILYIYCWYFHTVICVSVCRWWGWKGCLLCPSWWRSSWPRPLETASWRWRLSLTGPWCWQTLRRTTLIIFLMGYETLVPSERAGGGGHWGGGAVI